MISSSSRRESLSSLFTPLHWDVSARRNSLEPISFMDFAFFPVKGEDQTPNPTATASASDQQLLAATNMLLQPRPLPPVSMTPLQPTMPSSIAGRLTPTPMAPSQHNFACAVADLASSSGGNILLNSTIKNDLPPLMSSDVSESTGSPSDDVSDASVHHQNNNNFTSDEQGSDGNRFKPFHEEKWSLRFRELLIFRDEHGHSAVPHTYPKVSHWKSWK